MTVKTIYAYEYAQNVSAYSGTPDALIVYAPGACYVVGAGKPVDGLIPLIVGCDSLVDHLPGYLVRKPYRVVTAEALTEISIVTQDEPGYFKFLPTAWRVSRIDGKWLYSMDLPELAQQHSWAPHLQEIRMPISGNIELSWEIPALGAFDAGALDMLEKVGRNLKALEYLARHLKHLRTPIEIVE